MFKKIWERYFLFEMMRVFSLFLFCFYGLYVLIDYASHTSALAHHHVHIRWYEITRYYLYIFASRAEILLPLALLIAFVKTVCTLNTRQELVALMASGIKLKTLMKPFIAMGMLCVILMYANEQFLLPTALKKLRRFEDAVKHQKSSKSQGIAVRHIVLEDGSLLLFQGYDTDKERFFDVYWIESIDNIYKMRYLSPYPALPKGDFVDRLVRQPSGELLLETSHKEQIFPQLRFNRELLRSTIIDPDILSLTTLAEQARQISPAPDEKESKVLTAFYWKLIIPWLCLLAIIAPAPYCVRYSRQQPIFMIYVCSLFGLIAFYMFMDAAQVVAKRQLLEPFWVLIVPFLVVSGCCTWRFAKMQ